MIQDCFKSLVEKSKGLQQQERSILVLQSLIQITDMIAIFDERIMARSDIIYDFVNLIQQNYLKIIQESVDTLFQIIKSIC